MFFTKWSVYSILAKWIRGFLLGASCDILGYPPAVLSAQDAFDLLASSSSLESCVGSGFKVPLLMVFRVIVDPNPPEGFKLLKQFLFKIMGYVVAFGYGYISIDP